MAESPSDPTGQGAPSQGNEGFPHTAQTSTSWGFDATKHTMLRTQKGLTFSSGSDEGGLGSQSPVRV